jgi:hypothetical protein
LLRAPIAPGSTVSTDADGIARRLDERGDEPRSVCPAAGEFARHEDGDGSCAVHVDTPEGFWSPLWSWLRLRRGIAKEWSLGLGSFEFVPTVRRRGKTLLGSLIELLVRPSPRNIG